MLQTQVNYWTLMETQRHNKEMERQGWESLSETGRHNKSTEGLTAQDLSEKGRHNRAAESLEAWDIQERGRHNRTSEKLNYLDVSEKARHNQFEEELAADKFNWDKGFGAFEHQDDYNLKVDQQDIDLYKAESAEKQATAQQQNAISKALEAAARIASMFMK